MTRPESFLRGPASFRRSKPSSPPSGKAFLIVTEGKKTEPNYFIALRNWLKISVADVEVIHPEGTDPLTLTRKAVQLRDDRRTMARKGFAIAYDEVWVVFDLEKPHDKRRKLAAKAMQLREATGIKFALSDPSFEYWLLLHEEYTTAPFVDCHAVIKRLRKFWAGYTKGVIPSSRFIEKLPTAVIHAERCRKHHKDCQGDGNPSTKVDILARLLNSATRTHFQFKLGQRLGC